MPSALFAQEYSVHGIGIDVPENTVGMQINNLGQVIGTIKPPAAPLPGYFHYDPEFGITRMDRGRYNDSQRQVFFLNDINDQGLVTAMCFRKPKMSTEACILDERMQLHWLPNLGGWISYVGGINNYGQMVGHAQVQSGDVYNAIWQNFQITNLYPNEPIWQETPEDISDSGAIVGRMNMDAAKYFEGYFWRDTNDNGLMEPAEKVAITGFGGDMVFPLSINRADRVVGFATSPNGKNRAFVWTQADGTKDLGTLGGDEAEAASINDHGDIVGASKDNLGTYRAFIYRDGEIIDLNTMIPSKSGWILERANSINNLGQIVGAGNYKGNSKAFILTPLKLSKIRIFPLKENYEVYYRIGHKYKMLSPDAWGNLLEGTFRIRAETETGNPNKVDTTWVNVYSDADPKGIDIEVTETAVDSHLFWSREAISVVSDDKSQGMVLHVEYGDRIYVRQYEKDYADRAFVGGGGVRTFHPPISPAWRIPDSRAQYSTMALYMPGGFSIPSILSEPGPDFAGILRDPQYPTPEEMIFLKWRLIQNAATIEGVPAPLLAAILLQNMRSMNWFDIVVDGAPGQLVGKSIGISQTPFYILQKVAANHGITSLRIPPGTSLSDDAAVELLFDADKSIYVAAAHIRMLVNRAMAYIQGNFPKPHWPQYMAGFDLNQIPARGEATQAQAETAAIIGYNLDQWQMNGRPDSMFYSGDRYEIGIILALKDVLKNINPDGSINFKLTQTPRLYVESVIDNCTQPFAEWCLDVTEEMRAYRLFKAGDIVPNFHMRED